MSASEKAKRWAQVMLGIDPESITEVRSVLSKTPIIDGVALRGIRWSDIVIATGDRLGYCDATPGVLYVLGSATH